jgi:type IV pilus assembly protein PilX
MNHNLSHCSQPRSHQRSHQRSYSRSHSRAHITPAARQRGVVMLFGLLALVIMMIGAVAMVRSMNTSLSNSGNLGFKRDLTNQGERATAMVINALQTGALMTDVTRRDSLPASNYSATFLASNAQGMPNALIEDADFAAVGTSANDITNAAQGITVRYVLDRMCARTGAATPAHCTMSDANLPTGGSASATAPIESAVLAAQAVYRLSIRVEGPRRTQAFFQTTLTL